VTAITGPVPRAVTVDLDDTLFPQQRYLAGAWRAVAGAAGRHGIPEQQLLAALQKIAAQGSDRGGIIDRALAQCGTPGGPELVPELVAAFRGYRPGSLATYPGAREMLRRVRDHVPVACVTDGDPGIQRAKLSALGLADAFDAIVISDEIGREFRKPHAAPFLAALDALGVPPADAIHIGDRPEKDVAGPHRIGMRAIRVRTGEYATAPAGTPPADFTFDQVASALQAVEASARRGTRPASR
jgi:HAD superfamily hydrolase (TIGR01549 family)